MFNRCLAVGLFLCVERSQIHREGKKPPFILNVFTKYDGVHLSIYLCILLSLELCSACEYNLIDSDWKGKVSSSSSDFSKYFHWKNEKDVMSSLGLSEARIHIDSVFCYLFIRDPILPKTTASRHDTVQTVCVCFSLEKPWL